MDAAVSAVIAAGYDEVEDAKKRAEAAVALTVNRVADAVRLTRAATEKSDS
jgi:hypothetical protein